jgi:hypothetical protein
MLTVAVHVLEALGATDFYNPMNISLDDPTNEDEFKLIRFKSPRPVTWQMYQEKEPEVIQKVRAQMITYAKKQIEERCLKALQDSDYLMLTDNFSLLVNGDDWIAYRRMLRSLPETLDYTTLFFAPLQIDIQNALPQPPPKIRKTE